MLKKVIGISACITFAVLMAPAYSQTAPAESTEPTNDASVQQVHPDHPTATQEQREKVRHHRKEMHKHHKEWQHRHDHVKPEVHTPAGGMAPVDAPAARGEGFDQNGAAPAAQ